jgi:hypothetical protein
VSKNIGKLDRMSVFARFVGHYIMSQNKYGRRNSQKVHQPTAGAAALDVLR